MAPSSTWLNLTDLGRIYGMTAIHCGRTLQKEGLRDQRGYPTPRAVQVGAAHTSSLNHSQKSTVWNSKICKSFFEKTGYQPIGRALQIEQWVQLLEALEEGSPGIAATPDQMAEEIPYEYITEVNNLLAKRGCIFRVNPTNIVAQKS